MFLMSYEKAPQLAMHPIIGRCPCKIPKLAIFSDVREHVIMAQMPLDLGGIYRKSALQTLLYTWQGVYYSLYLFFSPVVQSSWSCRTLQWEKAAACTQTYSGMPKSL